MTGNNRLGGRYRLLEHVGSGGMSSVWRGHDEVLRRTVAIKVLNPEYASDPDRRASVYREAQAAARLLHPHVASVFDYGETSGGGLESDPGLFGPYVVMEYLPGPSLARVLADEGVLPWSRAAAICAQVASALAAAHAQGIVHRDVKPANVIIASTGAKVVDFGISALVGETDREPDGQLLGTPAYVAPERVAGCQAGTATDVYALGLLLYRCLAGTSPWEAETITQMLVAHRYVEPSPLPADIAMPAGLRQLCEQCLAKSPEDRPSSGEAAATLAELAGISLPIVDVYPARIELDEPATMNLGSDVTQTVSHAETQARTEAQDRTELLARTQAPGRTGAQGRGIGRGRAGVAGWRWQTAAAMCAAAGAVLVFAVSTSRAEPVPVGHISAAAAPSTDRCAVRYVMERSGSDEFQASVKVSNSGEQALSNATLRFTFAGDQTVTAAKPWSQHGRDVIATLTDTGQALPVGGSVDIHLNGTYHTENSLPLAFYVGSTRCDASVVAPVTVPVPPSVPSQAGQSTPSSYNDHAAPKPAEPKPVEHKPAEPKPDAPKKADKPPKP